jgi:hypothetical protein
MCFLYFPVDRFGFMVHGFGYDVSSDDLFLYGILLSSLKQLYECKDD